MLWRKFPETRPEKVGYYLTLYYNSEAKQVMFKALWWGNSKWWPWKPSVKGLIVVFAFIPESCNKFYIPCMQWKAPQGQEEGKPDPAWVPDGYKHTI